ncbi:hypothetical protein [Streptomyces sp. NPDC004065]|uniref:hypothetical protein n=1 Tax=Streptomyces sp. NPDC004065 TaxID=3364689 RepID=UPI00384CEEF1
MRKYQKAAVVVAMLGSVGFLGAGVSQANGDDDAAFKLDNKQSQSCSADETNITGSSTASDIFTPVNTAGLQLNDRSERTSVTCTQLLTLGH